MKKFVRKLMRVSTHSYAIVLPKELVKQFGWKEKQKLVVIAKNGKPELIVKDWEK